MCTECNLRGKLIYCKLIHVLMGIIVIAFESAIFLIGINFNKLNKLIFLILFIKFLKFHFNLILKIFFEQHDESGTI